MDCIKKALVTGGSRGIGKGIATALAKDGYDVAISYAAKKQQAWEVSDIIRDIHNRKCFVFQANLEERGAGETLVRKSAEALGGLDLLVNNAGVTIFDSILDIKTDDLEKLINLDFKNYILSAREAALYMIKNGIKGNIINITSSRAQRAYPGDSIYGGLKAGLNRAFESIALDLAPYGIRVNCIAPGAIRIRSNEEIAKGEFNAPDRFWDRFGCKIPLGRAGEISDVGDAVVFLASEKASYITGVTLRIDGGLILPGIPETVEN